MFCQNCGTPIPEGTNICPNCGAMSGPEPVIIPDYRCSRLAAALLGILLGGLGIHNFYLGNTSKGLTQLLISTAGGLLTCGIASVVVKIWALIEGILILTTPNKTDAFGRPLKD